MTDTSSKSPMDRQDERRRILESVRDGTMSAEDAAAIMRGAGPRHALSGPAPHTTAEASLGWYEPCWVPTSVAPEQGLSGGGVVVVGTGARPTGLPEECSYVEHRDGGVPHPARSSRHEVVDLSRTESWSAVMESFPDGGSRGRRIVVLDAGDLPGESGLSVAPWLVHALCEAGGQGPTTIVWVVSGQRASLRTAAVGAFGQIVALEEAGLSLVAVDAGQECEVVEAARIGIHELGCPRPGSSEVRYDGDQRSVRDLRIVVPDLPRAAPIVERGSTCLITGGAGGLGLAVATELAKTCQARIILVGRRAPDVATTQLCEDLAGHGGEAVYVSADVSDATDVGHAVDEAVRRFGPLQNIFHLAGSSTGALVRNVDEQEVRANWAAKVDGAVHLDAATRAQPLQRFVLFSSFSAYGGAPGQSVYAAASRALAEFAATREDVDGAGQRPGQTQAVVWPMWADGGLTIDDWTREHLYEVTGQIPLPAATGLEALALAMSAPQLQLIPIFGDLDTFESFRTQHLGVRTDEAPETLAPESGAPRAVAVASSSTLSTAASGTSGVAQATTWLTDVIERTAKFPPGHVGPDDEFDALGVDSLLVRRLSVAMEKRLGPQPASQFYENRCVRELATHLVEAHPEEFQGEVEEARTETAERPAQSPVAPLPSEAPASPSEDIAIIGMAGRFPGSGDIDAFWANLVAGADLVTEIPSDRWDADEYFAPGQATPGRTNSRWGGFLDGVADFDPLFFGISPRESELIDPQERLFLETAWHALEDAACSRALLHEATLRDDEHRVGVFAGVTSGQYQLFGIEQWAEGNRVSPTSSYWAVANRLSYVLDAHGPSLTIDTACSSSLVTVHQACESIRRGESLVAIAGGVNVTLHPAKYVALAQSRFLSSEGRCRAFGRDGDGYVPGEGVGVVVLKPLDAALRDGDPVRAVIKATAVNHGGRTNGFTVPGPRAQSSVVSTALRRGGVDPESVSYVEAHGTGTALGDPIEIEGLTRAFGRGMERGSCAIGSVKSNIGHLEAAAGVAGLMKCVLQMEHRTLVPTLHADPLNPEIDWDHSPFRPQRRAAAWTPPAGQPLRAAVSSFGAGGANAHTVVEAWQGPHEEGTSEPGEEVVLLSARTPQDLRRLAHRLAADLRRRGNSVRLCDVAWTLAVGRDAQQTRAGLRASSVAELCESLERLAGSDELDHGVPVIADRTLDEQRMTEAVSGWLRGETIDAAELFGDGKHRRRIHLPGYPFGRSRYWIGDRGKDTGAEVTRPAPGVESADGLRIRWDDPVVAEHLVHGHRVLPGVAHVLAAIGPDVEGPHSLEEIEWRRGLTVPPNGEVSVTATVDEAPWGSIFTLASGHGERATTHSVGRIVSVPQRGHRRQTLDLESVRTRCREPLSAEAVYASAEARGITYGGSYRGLAEVRRSADGDEVLASLAPVEESTASVFAKGWWCSVSFLDSVLHPLLATSDDAPHALVPHSLDRIDLIAVPQGTAWVHAQVRSRRFDPPGAVCDVTVTDAQGEVCISMSGLFAVSMPPKADTDSRDEGTGPVRADPAEAASSEAVPCLLPRWEPFRPPVPEPDGAKGRRVVVLTTSADFGLGNALAALHSGQDRAPVRVVGPDDIPDVSEIEGLVQDLEPGDAVYVLTGMEEKRYCADDADHATAVQRRTVLTLARLCQALSRLPGRARGVRVAVVTNDVQQLDDETAWNPFAGGLLGFTRVAASELPGVSFLSIDLTSDDIGLGTRATTETARRITRLRPTESGDELALRGEMVLRRHFVPASMPTAGAATEAFDEGGTYLVVGGAGGLGMATARMLTTRCSADVYLVGRRPDADLPEQVRSELAADPRLHYLCGDVTDEDDMRRAVRVAAGPHGRLDGVIHAAFVMGDRVIATMTEDELLTMLAPKVAGSVALSRALADVDVALMVFFSSSISFTGARGQSSYAAASSFQDVYARFVASRWGRSVTIFDWGFWGEAGAVAIDDYRDRMADVGVTGLSTQEGLAALVTGVGARLRQVAPFRAEGLAPQWQLRMPSRTSLMPQLRADLHTFHERAEELQDVQALDELEAVARCALVERTDLLGIPESGERTDQVASRLGVEHTRRPHLDGVLDIMVRNGYVEVDEYGFLTPTALGQETRSRSGAAGRGADDLLARHPETGGYLTLVERCAAALPSILRGDLTGNEVLFPRGSDELVAAVYRGSRRSDHFNSLVGEAVRRVAEHSPDPVRILEVGAGTGATTDHVLDAVSDRGMRVAQYDFTDISPSLVRLAGERFGHGPVNVRVGVLDIQHSPAEQGYDDGAYDVVLATNVLHATRDMARTLENVASLLRPGGIIVINEVTRVRDFVTLVFGLTEGWWYSEDQDLRIAHSPLMTTNAWHLTARAAGFEHFSAFGSHPIDESGDQFVMLAERDSWGRLEPGHEVAHAPDGETGKRETGAPLRPVPAGEDGVALDMDHLAERLGEVYADVLHVRGEPIDPGLPLSSYGCDSVASLEVLDRLESLLGPVPSKIVLGAANLRDLAADLAAEHADLLGDQFPGTTQHAGATPVEEVPQPTAPSAMAERPVHAPVAVQPTPAAETSAEPEAARSVGEIAIIGMAGRYPGAQDLDAWWQVLGEGRSVISGVPEDRWARGAAGDAPGTHWGSFLDNIDEFDSLLFQVSPREAATMDPQVRLFLESVWNVLDNAGYTRARATARARASRNAGVGVFVGAMYTPYELLAAEEWARGHRAVASSGSWTIANRVSYTFGFTGPSLAVDTACSSSATSIHLACESLRREESGMAVAGGVNLILHPGHHFGLAHGGLLSDSGRPLPFSDAADGMVTGEGVGALLLRPLEDALRDGDPVLGLILGSALGANGQREHFTAPDPAAQEDLTRETLRTAGIEPSDISYIEAQAVGSPLGDAAEAEALKEIFGHGYDGGAGCAVGTLKSGLGHLEAASGVAQVSKVLLQLRHEQIAPAVDAVDPFTSTDEASLHVARVRQPWEKQSLHGTPRRALVNSYGAGGANAQILIQEAPHQGRTIGNSHDGRALPFILSARKPAQLRQVAERLVEALSSSREPLDARDVAYTLLVGREPLNRRVAVVAEDLDTLVGRLRQWLASSDVAELSGVFETGSVEQGSTVADPAEQIARSWVQGLAPTWEDLGVPEGQIVVLPSYPFARERHWLDMTESPLPQNLGADNQSEESRLVLGDNSAEDVAVDETGGGGLMWSERVRAALGAVLQVNPAAIDDDDSFGDFGLDSVSVMALAERMHAEHGVELVPSDFYNLRTVGDLSALVAASAEPGTQLSPVQETPPRPAAPAGRMAEMRPAPDDAIAIVGLSARLPGARNIEQYWRATLAGNIETHPLPQSRGGTQASGAPGATTEHMGTFLDGIDEFDPEFFGISPREARLMDPQHRIFLTTVWHTIEDAGYDPRGLAASQTGIFVGVAGTEYGQLLRAAGVTTDGQLATGNVHSVLANRISYLLDLRGPSEPVDTACSSSLVAVHRAVQAIRSGECTLAVAGGVNVVLTAMGFEAFGLSGMLAQDGRCKTFDSRADGYVRGEGVGAVLLKPLATAQADGDNVYAIIRGSAIGHGGRTASLTAPNASAQADVVTRAWSEAGVDGGPQFIEAHGTGTQLGDPVEVDGLKLAFERLRTQGIESESCGLSTGKTGIGHLETAAGVAGLIRAVLALQHRVRPPLAGFGSANELLDLSGSSFSLVTEPQAWDFSLGHDGAPRPRRAGVSSFGFGGVNAHVALEEAPSVTDIPAPEVGASDHVAVLSAGDQTALRESAQALADALCPATSNRRLSLADVTYTLQVGRAEMSHRLAIVASDIRGVVDGLRGFLAGDDRVNVYVRSGPTITGSERAGVLGPEQEWPASPHELARLWTGGHPVDWHSARSGARRRVSLPGYPFARDRYWLAAEGSVGGAPDEVAVSRDVPTREQAPTDDDSREPAVTAQASSDLGGPDAPRDPGAEPEMPAALPERVDDVPSESKGTGRDALVRRFTQIVSDHLEVPAQQIDKDLDISTIGVDSIAALRIMQSVHKEYGDGIPMLAIIEHPTVNRFVDNVLRPEVGFEPFTDSTSAVVGESPVNRAPDVATQTDGPKELVAPAYRLADGRSAKEPPVFCVHADTGELTWALALLRDEPDRLVAGGDVFGVESPIFGAPTDGSQIDLGTRADACVRSIRERAADQPVLLVAHRRSSLLGVEIARRLLDADVQVPELTLIAPPPSPTWSPEPCGEREDLDEVVTELAHAWRVDLDGISAEPGAPMQTYLRAVAERLATGESGMGPEEIRDWVSDSVRHRRGLAEALRVADQPSPLVGVDRVTVWGDAGSWDRLIVPPPIEVCARSTDIDDAAPAPSIEVVPINRDGAAPASFWSHSLLGDVSYALNLSRHFGTSYPVFGLEQFGAHGEIRLFDAVKDLARAHIEELRKVDPIGPYTLGGYSMGGILAFETARQLVEEDGANVRHVTLIDPIMPGTPAWDAIETEKIEDYDFDLVSLVLIANAFGDRWDVEESLSHEQLLGKDRTTQIREVAHHLHAGSAGKRELDDVVELVSANHAVITTNNAALERYQPTPLASPVPTVLLRASLGHIGPDNPNGLPLVGRLADDPSNGFAPFVGASLDIVDVHADHFTICDRQHIEGVAAAVERSWSALDVRV